MMELSNTGNAAMCMALDDWVSIGEFCSFVISDGLAASHREALPFALDEISGLVCLDFVEIGGIQKGGWLRWETSMEESFRYIKSYAENHEGWFFALWLQITEKGRAYAETLDPDDYIDDE